MCFGIYISDYIENSDTDIRYSQLSKIANYVDKSTSGILAVPSDYINTISLLSIDQIEKYIEEDNSFEWFRKKYNLPKKINL